MTSGDGCSKGYTAGEFGGGGGEGGGVLWKIGWGCCILSSLLTLGYPCELRIQPSPPRFMMLSRPSVPTPYVLHCILHSRSRAVIPRRRRERRVSAVQ